jgi:ElaB/YqjD/DUF883 family membrane-anchored ribosome-binding protein
MSVKRARDASATLKGHCVFIKGENNMTSQQAVAAQEKLVSDIKSVISDAEDVLNATADQAGDKVASLRARIQSRLGDAKVRLVEAEALLVAKSKAAARATDAYVHESPWQAVGIAAGVGLLVGLVLGRR